MKKKESILIEIDKVKTNPFQPRKVFKEEEIAELAESIKNHGLIQPIIVRPSNDGYQLISGERRLRACGSAGLTTISAIVMEIDGVEIAEISLIENIQRKDLNCVEEGEAYSILKNKFGMTQEEIAQRLGKSRPYVANLLRILDLPEEARKDLLEGKITMGHGRAVLGLPTTELMLEVVDRIKREALSVRQTESLIQEILSGSKISKKRKEKVAKYFKGAREYYNVLKTTMSDIRSSGGKADLIERETEDFFELTIRISKAEAMISDENADVIPLT